jgi:hypothetical protein
MGDGMRENETPRRKTLTVAAEQRLHGPRGADEIGRLGSAPGPSKPATGRARRRIRFSTVTQTVS